MEFIIHIYGTKEDLEIMKTLKDLRTDAGLSQREVADHMGITLGNYRFLERGEIRLPVWYALALSEIYGCDVETIAYATLATIEDRVVWKPRK